MKREVRFVELYMMSAFPDIKARVRFFKKKHEVKIPALNMIKTIQCAINAFLMIDEVCDS